MAHLWWYREAVEAVVVEEAVEAVAVEMMEMA